MGNNNQDVAVVTNWAILVMCATLYTINQRMFMLLRLNPLVI